MKRNLSVKLCGKTLANPVIAASGCFGFGQEMANYYDLNKLGGIALKGITLEERQGNPPPRIAETPSGMLNSVGLQNPGVKAFKEQEMPRIKDLSTMLFANIAGSTVEDYCRVAEELRHTAVDFIEMNISCPNVKEGGAAFGAHPQMIEDITRQVKKHCKQPLIVKLSPNTVDIANNAKAAEQGGADGISLINTLIGMAVDVRTRKPILGNVIGGLSGPAIRPVALRMVWQAAKAVDIPVIGMGGIMTGEDAISFLMAGATAVMVGSLNLIDPEGCLDVINGIEKFMIEEGIEDINHIIDTLEV